MRKIINLEFEDVEIKDYPNFSNAFISYAQWASTGLALTEWELEQFEAGDFWDEMYQSIL